MSDKPREWYLVLTESGGLKVETKPDEYWHSIHVIEYSALENAQAEIERLKDEAHQALTNADYANKDLALMQIDRDGIEEKLTAAEAEIDRLNKYTIAGYEVMLAELKAEIEQLKQQLIAKNVGIAHLKSEKQIHNKEQDEFNQKMLDKLTAAEKLIERLADALRSEQVAIENDGHVCYTETDEVLSAYETWKAGRE